MKRLVSMLLTAILLFGMMPVSAVTDSDEALLGESYTDNQGLVYTLSEEGTYYIVTGFKGDSPTVEVAAFFNDLPVLTIGVDAFSNNTTLTNVIIPYGITTIDYCAFYGCVNLTNVTLPNSIETFGDYAFFNCSSFTEIVFPPSVTTIGESAFSSCYALMSVSIPEGIEYIGQTAFVGSAVLSDISVAVNNKNYHSENNCLIDTTTGALLLGCKNSTIPDYVTAIADYAFYNCSKLTKITLPNTVETIGSCAFSMCENLTNITIPNSVVSIGNYAFSDCYNVTNVFLGKALCSIGVMAFDGCNNITNIKIPTSVSSMGDYVFSRCSKLKDIYCEAEQTPIGWSDDWQGISSATVHWGQKDDFSDEPAPATDGLDFSLDETQTYYIVTDYTGESEDVVIPETYKELPVTTIGYRAFERCYLRTLSIPKTITHIEPLAFLFGKITDVHITDLSAWCKIEFYPDYSKGYINTNPLSFANNLYINSALADNIVIPESVTEICAAAFYKFSGLTSVTLPNSLISIEKYAFEGCVNLSEITLPLSIKTLGSEVLDGCEKLKNVYCQPKTQPETWDSDWLGNCTAKVEWAYTVEYATEELDEVISETEELDDSEYTTEQFASIRFALNFAKNYDTTEQTVRNIKSVTEAVNEIIDGKSLVKGDADRNGEVDQFDYLMIKRNYFDTYALYSGDLLRVDVYNSNSIDQMDYLMVKRAYFGTYVIE